MSGLGYFLILVTVDAQCLCPLIHWELKNSKFLFLHFIFTYYLGYFHKATLHLTYYFVPPITVHIG